jgi:hypothetical protein
MKKFFASALVMFFMIIGIQAFAQEGTWERVGVRKVSYGVEKDVVMVTSKKGKFTKLQLKVKDAPVNFRDMKVYFGNGSVQDVSLRNTIPAGGESRVIDLDGGERTIVKIEFIYDTKNNAKKRGTVVVLAKE